MNVKHIKRHRHDRAQARTDGRRAASSRRPSATPTQGSWTATLRRLLRRPHRTMGQQTALPIIDVIIRSDTDVPDRP